jgi:UDP-GlcNAc:undecaprenyl-phosphate/decaprenyl-phosphate GlcNAc-1-phosphate transferase
MPGAAVYCLNAFLLSVVMIFIMVKIAPRIGLVDVPTERKNHEGRIPLVGSGVFLAVCVTSILLQPPPRGILDFLVGMALIVLLGIIDDVVDLRASVKFAVQCAVVALMVLPNDFLIRNAGAILADRPLLLLHWAAPVTIFAVVGMINAVNLIDGLDGLAGGISFVALIWFAIAAAALGLPEELPLILVLAFGVLGFLIFNFRHPWRARAAVFLGDAGSMMLGLALAFVAITLTQRSSHPLPPITALWICALPVIDTLSLMIRRLAAGQSIAAVDHRHLHDVLVRAGLGVNHTVLVLIAVSGTLGGMGIAGWLLHLPDRVMLIGLAVPVGIHSWFSCYGWKHLHVSTSAIPIAGGAVPQMGPQIK